MSNHNLCFRGELRKILCGYPLIYSYVRKRKEEQINTKHNSTKNIFITTLDTTIKFVIMINLTATKPSLKKLQLVINYAEYLIQYFR